MSSSQKALNSALMLVGNGLAQKLIGLLSTLVLARVLVPEDFALVAIASLVIMFIEVFTITGSEQYILSQRTVSKSILHSAWTLDILVKTLASIVAIGLAYPLSLWYDDPELLPILLALAASPLLMGLNNPGLWRLKRHQRYMIVVGIQVISKILGVVVTIAVAVITKSYWALIIGQLLTSFAACFLSYVICSYRPNFSLVHLRQQYGFSSFMIGQELFGFLKSNIDTFFISKSYSNAEFGNFHVMKYIAVIPSLSIMVPLAEPLLVEMSKNNAQMEERLFKYTVSIIALLLVSFPISLIMFVHSKDIVSILLGSKWLEYHRILGYMGLLVTSFVVANHCKKALIILRKTNWVFVYELLTTVLVIATVVLALEDSVETLVWERVLVELLAVMLFFIIVTSFYLKQNCLRFLIKVLPLCLVFVVCSVFIVTIESFYSSYFTYSFVSFALSIISFVMLYFICVSTAYFIFYKHQREGRHIFAIVTRIVHKHT